MITRDTYRIGTDTLPTGQVKATARGRKTNTRTFPAGTTHESAARLLATKIEGDNLHSVTERSRNGDGSKRDWDINVNE